MQVREATAADAPVLMDLLRDLNPNDPRPELQRFAAQVEAIGRAGHLKLFVADSEGDVLGTCYLNVIPNLSRGLAPYALIENVVTHHAARRRGIGKLLLGHAVEHAFEAGCYKVMLMTGRKDDAVHAFYRGCGFDGDEKHAFVCRRPSSAD